MPPNNSLSFLKQPLIFLSETFISYTVYIYMYTYLSVALDTGTCGCAQALCNLGLIGKYTYNHTIYENLGWAENIAMHLYP